MIMSVMDMFLNEEWTKSRLWKMISWKCRYGSDYYALVPLDGFIMANVNVM